MCTDIRRSLSLLVLAATPFVALLGGCQVAAPTTGGEHPVGGVEDMSRPSRPDLTPPDDGTVSPPTLDAITRSTTFMSVPVHGLAKPDGTVLIEGTADGTISADVGTDGRFCVDAKLGANKANLLTLRTIGVNGTQSDPIQVTIMQTGTVQMQQPTTEVARNVALGGSGSGDRLYFERNDPSAMMDGDSTTSYGGRHTWGDYSIATTQLSGRSTINKVKITAPADCPFTAPFHIYTSNDDAPSNPRVQPMSWIEITTTTADTGSATVMLGTPVISTHISVVWDTPFNANGPSEVNCGSWALGPYYAIAEVEAWTVPGIPQLPQSAPSCSGGQ